MEIVRIGRQHGLFLDPVLALVFDPPHLHRIVVIVGQCPVDNSHIEVVTIRDRSRGKTAVLDLCFGELDGNTPPLEVQFVVTVPDGATRRLTHQLSLGLHRT